MKNYDLSKKERLVLIVLTSRKRSMTAMQISNELKKYDIKKTQFQIIKEYYENKGEIVSEKGISQLAKKFRQKEPEQFLTMYDSIRDKSKTE